MQQRLLSDGDKILVALSGGADSVALLLLLLGMGYHCEAVHCNFHLRGEESNRDERFVRALCRAHSVRLYVEDFDTMAYVREKKVSIEMAARDLRYAYFDRLRNDFGFEWVAVAHHCDDNIETMLLNLIRGTGLKGLAGMQYRNGYIVRPLLDVTRTEIEQYLEETRQTYVTDSTNLEPDVMRNKIRLEILPMLRDLNPSIGSTLQRTIRRLQESYTLYRAAVEEMKERVCHGHHIDLNALRNVPAPHTVLFEILSSYGFNSTQIEEVCHQLEGGGSGKMYQSRDWRLLRDRESLVLESKDSSYGCVCSVLPLEGFVKVAPDVTFSIRRVHYGSDFIIPKDRATACLDLGKIEYPITVRMAEGGDRFTPLGMKGTKLVSDYLTDVKKNLFEKERQLVVCSGGHIAWLVGERIDEHYRVDGNTDRILMIQAIKTDKEVM